jgi:hypothetical protein
MNKAAKEYLAAIGRRGGKAGKGSAAKAASARKANAARWEKHRKAKRAAATHGRWRNEKPRAKSLHALMRIW